MCCPCSEGGRISNCVYTPGITIEEENYSTYSNSRDGGNFIDRNNIDINCVIKLIPGLRPVTGGEASLKAVNSQR